MFALYLISCIKMIIFIKEVRLVFCLNVEIEMIVSHKMLNGKKGTVETRKIFKKIVADKNDLVKSDAGGLRGG